MRRSHITFREARLNPCAPCDYNSQTETTVGWFPPQRNEHSRCGKSLGIFEKLKPRQVWWPTQFKYMAFHRYRCTLGISYPRVELEGMMKPYENRSFLYALCCGCTWQSGFVKEDEEVGLSDYEKEAEGSSKLSLDYGVVYNYTCPHNYCRNGCVENGRSQRGRGRARFP